MTSDDEFEQRLRDVLHDGQLFVPPAADALDRVHAGVRRRHQHRIVASGVAAIAVVALAAGGVALRSPGDARPHPVAGAFLTASAAPTTTPSARPRVASPSSQLSSAAVQATTPSPAVAQLSIVSFTAVGLQSYWVLGATPGCTAGCTGVERTSDGGKTFERIGVTNEKTALPALANGTDTVSTVSDIRFADATHGWIYGGALLATSDAGDTWTPVAMPGLVVDLAAVNGAAWAVVQTTAASKTSFSVYRSDYAATGAANSWTKVALPIALGSTPSLAVQGSTAYVLADRVGGTPDVVIDLPVAGAATETAGPCGSELPIQISAGASKAILWAVCGGAHQSSFHSSADGGKTWQGTPVTSDAVTLGGISGTSAIIGQPAGRLQILGKNFETSPVSQPAASVARYPFVGFTNPTDGFAVVELTSGVGQLWRTTDSGHSWSVADIPS